MKTTKKTLNYQLQNNKNIQEYIATNPSVGLNNNDVIERQEKFGKNILQEAKKKNPFLVYLAQFKDLLVIILLCATLISYIMAIIYAFQNNWVYSKELLIAFIEPSIILFVVLTNSLIGTIQEIKSEKAINALKNLNPMQAKVKRNGNLLTINSSELVIGDIVFLEAGDIVPADGYLINSSNLQVIESSLTGESLPVLKDHNVKKDLSLPIGDQKFSVFSSSVVVAGNCIFVVTKTGINTELGKIASLVNNEKEQMTPLQTKINKLGKVFAIAGIILFVLSIIVQIIFQAISKGSFKNVIFWSTTLINGISLAVAAIPEGLVAFTSIILAIGIQKMAKQKAIVKNLMAVEALGSCSIICSDKTGTLTQNKMTIVDTFVLNKKYDIANHTSNLNLIEFASLCSEANLIKENDLYKETGDPTELAFLYYLEQTSSYKTKKILDEKFLRIKTLPFDSDRKLMTSINKINDENIVIVKGAPDILLQRCVNLAEKDQKIIKNTIDRWSDNTYRVLAIAKKSINNDILNKINNEKDSNAMSALENNLEFIGLVAMIDPPRETSKEAIAICKSAGIKPIMITGDNIKTAIAIAKQLGIYQDGDLALTGIELNKLSDDELNANIEKYSVYARVAPEDKIRIVHAWQTKNQVVAMTGDGVNDAPALKAADIGCAMGITGTEVSKQAANMVLADDNFATVVKAVENGRSIYQKIKNVIHNLLITSIAEIILVFFGLLIFKGIFKNEINALTISNPNFEFYILGATQLLWINLFTHGFPAIALGLQDSKENYMKNKPIPKSQSIFANGMGINMLWQGILVGIISLIGYYLGASLAIKNGKTSHFVEYGSTCAFLVLGICATFNAINLMSKKPIFMSNPLFYWKVYASVIFSLSALFIVSFISKIAIAFKITNDLSSNSTLIAYSLGLPLTLIPIYLTYKISVMLINKYKK